MFRGGGVTFFLALCCEWTREEPSASGTSDTHSLQTIRAYATPMIAIGAKNRARVTCKESHVLYIIRLDSNSIKLKTIQYEKHTYDLYVPHIFTARFWKIKYIT